MGFIDKFIGACKKWDPLFARILVGGMFVFAGIGKFMAPEAMAQFLSGTAPYLPAPLALIYLSGALEVLGGLALITGYFFRYGAFALACFTVVVTVIMHSDLSDQLQVTFATKNAAILGALLYMKAYGPGSFAIGAKKEGPFPSSAPAAA